MARPIVRSTKGFTELGENMRLLRGPLALKICGKATGKGAQLVKRAVKRKTPKSEKEHDLKIGAETIRIQPGNLEKNIIVKKIKSDLTSEHIVTVRGKKAGNYARRYGRLVEFGTVKMAPRSFVRAGFDQSKHEAVEVIRTSLDVEIGKAVAGLPK